MATAQASPQCRYLASMGLQSECSAVGQVPSGHSTQLVMFDVLVKDFPSHFAQSQQHSGNCDLGILYSPIKEQGICDICIS